MAKTVGIDVGDYSIKAVGAGLATVLGNIQVVLSVRPLGWQL